MKRSLGNDDANDIIKFVLFWCSVYGMYTAISLSNADYDNIIAVLTVTIIVCAQLNRCCEMVFNKIRSITLLRREITLIVDTNIYIISNI